MDPTTTITSDQFNATPQSAEDPKAENLFQYIGSLQCPSRSPDTVQAGPPHGSKYLVRPFY